jgi:hypothetical protein
VRRSSKVEGIPISHSDLLPSYISLSSDVPAKAGYERRPARWQMVICTMRACAPLFVCFEPWLLILEMNLTLLRFTI